MQIFGCEIGSLPFKNLGIPIHHRKLMNKEWKPVLIGKVLSYGDRLIVINSVLKSLPLLLLSFFEYPKGHEKD
jgi:hypothetical protein